MIINISLSFCSWANLIYCGKLKWPILNVFQIRLSVGLEDTDDLIEDLDQALKEAVSGNNTTL